MLTPAMSKMLLIVLLTINFLTTSAQGPTVIKRVRECLAKPTAVLCLKEEALDVLNRTIMSDKPMKFFDLIEIERDPSYKPSVIDNVIPDESEEARSEKLTGLLYNKVEEFFESRTIKFSLANVIEGRKKKDRTGSMLMMGGLAMAGMMGQMFMGKIAFLAGAALLVAKMALMMSAISALKKSGGGGGGSEHIVYATSSDSGHSHGGGGWHRSLGVPDSHNLVYNGQMPPNNNYS